MQILIMRHGEAVSAAATDAERALTDRGQQQALAAGETLRNLSLPIGAIWCSPYLRTRQTAARVLEGLASNIAITVRSELAPEATLAQIHTALAHTAHNCLLLVSHNPKVALLADLLLERGLSAGSRLQTPVQSRFSFAPASMALISLEVPGATIGEFQWQRHAPLFELTR